MSGAIELRKEKLTDELDCLFQSRELLVEDDVTEGYRELNGLDIRRILEGYPDYAMYPMDGDSLGRYVFSCVYVKNYDFKVVTLYDYVIDVFYNDILREEMNAYRHLSWVVESGLRGAREKTTAKYFDEVVAFLAELPDTELWKMAFARLAR